ncbi:hypothetical protein BHE74_00002420 [Ensete ventricosum]|nr:hypothetical protein B296_00049810 [Ensete ventricosum]RWW30540.1 hypothetical protein GW17_00004883 [Ensete ventricosum]RWW88695.1 hypothetical protein BHE74_00002420 [Ensete ventricosum]RZS06342.1 hypothetical protein BHM03_00036984 [Ensete ventricosum]
MAIESLSSPHRRSQSTNLSPSSPSKQQASGHVELGIWSTVLQRHRFLLTMLSLLAVLCTIYLYFAITLGATDSCAGMSGAEKALCQSNNVLRDGKIKFF